MALAVPAFAAPVPAILTAASNADLATYAISAAPNGLQRCGYVAPGDSPCLPMLASGTACSLIAFSGTVSTAVVPTTVLNVTAVTSGKLRPGLPLPSSAPGVTPGTIVTAQLTGTSGGVGTYSLSQPFNPPPSFTLTIRGDGASQVSSTDNKCWLANPGPSGIDLRSWGVVFDNATDNSWALQAALSWLVQGNALQIPAQSQPALFAHPVTATEPSASDAVVTGAGPDVSILEYTGGATDTAITINAVSVANTIHLRNFSLLSNSTAGTNTGIALVQTTDPIANPAITNMSDVSNVILRGADGYAGTQYWGTGIAVSGWSYINFNNLVAYGPASHAGTGVSMVGTATRLGVVYNFSDCTFALNNVGISYGIYTQGVTVTQSNFDQMNYGIQAATGTGTAQLAVTQSQFGNAGISAIQLDGVPHTLLSNNLCFLGIANNSTCVEFLHFNETIVSSNIFQYAGSATGTRAILLDQPTTLPGIIVNNIYNQLAIGVQYAVAGTYDIYMSGNRYLSLTSAPLLGPGSALYYADSVSAFATLAGCDAAHQSWRVPISDSTVNTFGATIAGSGSNRGTAVCNASIWVYSW